MDRAAASIRQDPVIAADLPRRARPGDAGGMRVLVTGGAGFIGRPTVRALAAAGHDVTVLDSLRPDVHRTAPDVPGGRLVRGDVRDEDLVGTLTQDADVVVHLAAKVGLGVDLGDIVDYVSSNDLGTACVLRAAAHERRRTGRVRQLDGRVRRGCLRLRGARTGRARTAPARGPRRGRLRPALPALRRRPGADARDRGRPARSRATSTRRPRCTASTCCPRGCARPAAARSRSGSTTSTAPGSPRDTPVRRRRVALPVRARRRTTSARVRGRRAAARLRARARRRGSRRCRGPRGHRRASSR